MEPFFADIEQLTEANTDFRRVIGTFGHSQLVLMSLLPREEIGTEVHHAVDQFFRVESGNGKAVVGDSEYALKDGSALVVPAGVEHNIVNTGGEPLKLYTIYSPANHPDGTVHATKADADRAEAEGH